MDNLNSLDDLDLDLELNNSFLLHDDDNDLSNFEESHSDLDLDLGLDSEDEINVHSGTDQRLLCTTCMKTFKNKKSLTAHKRIIIAMLLH